MVDQYIFEKTNRSFYKMKNYATGQSAIDTKVRYVHTAVIQEFGDIVLSIVEIKKSNPLYSMSEIMEHFENKTKKQISEIR